MVIAKLAILFLRALVKRDVLIFFTNINNYLIFRQKLLLPFLEGRDKRFLQPAEGALSSVHVLMVTSVISQLTCPNLFAGAPDYDSSCPEKDSFFLHSSTICKWLLERNF